MANQTKSNGYRYWISENRRKELEHFCRQYHDWQLRLNCVNSMSKIPEEKLSKNGTYSDPTANAAEVREYFTDRMDMVRDCCHKAASEIIAKCIFDAVTNGYSYDQLCSKREVPCGRRQFYEARQRFFWHLSCARG